MYWTLYEIDFINCLIVINLAISVLLLVVVVYMVRYGFLLPSANMEAQLFITTNALMSAQKRIFFHLGLNHTSTSTTISSKNNKNHPGNSTTTTSTNTTMATTQEQQGLNASVVELLPAANRTIAKYLSGP